MEAGDLDTVAQREDAADLARLHDERRSSVWSTRSSSSAAKERASDIHIAPQGRHLRRFRVDGVLVQE